MLDDFRKDQEDFKRKLDNSNHDKSFNLRGTEIEEVKKSTRPITIKPNEQLATHQSF